MYWTEKPAFNSMQIKYKPVLLKNFFGCENVQENTIITFNKCRLFNVDTEIKNIMEKCVWVFTFPVHTDLPCIECDFWNLPLGF